ncbi:ABC transporter substrate-binding protein [Acinetobacter qingfengensis]|uniref:Thiamine pyrimidine synthase n=1 Tax=Acinetobacter qingfengensis TaxID=1262585 RepID=A0A1E7R3A4_9GAMM|nr:ABC transporter substrate-binding protein [Acinetobacter qingfengensis]KAA8733746.1 ABC transporter substrate-binding protein [Acinetobacter qingfengensis]OEY93743.1 ABC transporter substrate-binding protein [Acinetobacter qingfengensis]
MSVIKIALEYFHPWPNSAGFYYARQQGWFAQYGLDVEFVVVDPLKGDALEYLNQQRVDFAIFPTNRLWVRRELGQPLLGIAAINHTGLEAIQTLKSLGIDRPKALENKRLALNPTARGLAMVRHLVERDGGDFDQVILVDAGYREYTPDELQAGLADASFGGYWVWEALMESHIAAEERIVWPVSQIGAPTYHSYLLGINEEQQHLSALQIRQFLQVARQGYQAVAQQPDVAVEIYEQVIPYFPQTLIRKSLHAVATTWHAAQGWGIQNHDFHRQYSAWLAQYGILKDVEIWQSATSNDYLVEQTHVAV